MIYCRHLGRPSLALLSIFLSCSFSSTSAFLFDSESNNRRYNITAQPGDPLLVDIQLHNANSGNSTDLRTGVSLVVGVPYTGDFGDISQIPSGHYFIRILESFSGHFLKDFSVSLAPPPPPPFPPATSSVSGDLSMSSAKSPSLATMPPRPEPGPGLQLSKGVLTAVILTALLLVACCAVALFLCWRRKLHLRRDLSLMGSTTRAATKQPYSTLGSESTLVVSFEANKSQTLSQLESAKAGMGDEDAPLARTDFLKRERDRINQQLEILEGRCVSDEPDALKQTGEDNILFQINALKDKIQFLEARQRLRHHSSSHHHHDHSHSKSPFDSPPEYDSSPHDNPHSIYGQQPFPREDKTQCFCGSCN